MARRGSNVPPAAKQNTNRRLVHNEKVQRERVAIFGSAGQLGVELDDKEPQEIIEWSLDTFGRRVSICTSFQADGMAILDMAWRIDPKVRVFVDVGTRPHAS